jgi:CHAT domain/Peptidase family C25
MRMYTDSRNRTATGNLRTAPAAALAHWDRPSEPKRKQANLKGNKLASPAEAASTAAPVERTHEANQASVLTTAMEDVVVHVTLIRGGITNVRVPVAIGPRYDGLPTAGPTKSFDRLLDSWLTQAIDLGMIGSGLGELFPINLQRSQEAGTLLVAGMGEPGKFAQDDLRFLVSNLIVAVKSMGHNQFATDLIGTRRKELSIGDAVRGLVDGIKDGYERFRAIADVMTDSRERFLQAAGRPLDVVLVDPDQDKLKQIQNAFEAIVSERAIPGLKLDVVRGNDVPPDPIIDSAAVDTEPDVPANLLRVTRLRRCAPASAVAGAVATEVFQFSALSECAAVPVREQRINGYLINELPDRMTKASSPQEREDFGTLFADLLIPEDFRKLTEGAVNLTLEVDENTAIFPWEMVAHKKYSSASFLSTSACVSRQFRSLLSPPPSSPPALNKRLKVLIIADPAPGNLSLLQARQEGLSVVDVLDQARRAWRGEYDIRVTVRIGSRGDDTLAPILENLRKRGSWVESAELCDPLELAMRIVDGQYDVVHYAGHGRFDKKTRQAGWVFAPDCFLSAEEIFRVRQVPRLVFANSCFSAVTGDHNEQRSHMAGLARAFFARGIPNFIGTGWQVDDACARECARWFYARVLGLRNPDDTNAVTGASPPSTIGDSLREARRHVLSFKKESSSWGAYQHYGRVSDKLVAPPNSPETQDGKVGCAEKEMLITGQSSKAFSLLSLSRSSQISTRAKADESPTAAADPNLIYVNGIDFETGKYSFAPRSIEDLAKQVLVRPGVTAFSELHSETPRSFGMPFGMDPAKLEEAGWGIIFHEDTPQDIRAALEPLVKLRQRQARDRCKMLEYRKGEQTRGWYQRHHISAGNIDPEIVPYYLLLVGQPDLLPFDFQYLLGVEYAVGRLAFDTAAEYERYARSIVDYESANAVPNAKEIAYWGTRHLGDPATNLSASLLIDPLANGIAQAAGTLKRPIHSDVGYDRKLHLGEDATKENLLTNLHATKPPAMLLTASHGMAVRSGQPNQQTNQGALLCQDWPGFGNVRAEHFLAAADVAADANVKGLVAFLFACFGNGTPDADQFPMDLSQAGATPALAPKPFIAALPQRLLAHPNGSALAVIGHVDRAWAFSIQAPKVAEAQIGTFRNSLGFILSGAPVGHAMCGQFGARFAALSTALASSTSPTAPTAMRLSDRDLVTYWLERNDAQNYALLGDPAVRIRTDALA